jgi:hypothetical protein
MRLSRDAGILVALVAVLGIGLLIVIRRDQPVGPPFRLDGHGPSGLSGLGAGLNVAGYDVRSGRRPVMPREGLTITVNPQGFSIDEAGRWTETVRAGGTLLLATDRNGPLTDALGLLVARGENVPVDTPASSRAFPGIGTPTGPVAATFTGVPDGAQALWTSNGRDVMVVFPLGRGSVWAISDPRWLTNEGVREMGLPVALPLAERAHGAVTVDEYHHGVGESAGSFGYLPGWLQLVVLQLLIALVAAMVTAARRLGPVHPVREPPTRSTAELAGSLARMHRKAGRLEAATRPLAAELRRRPGGTSAAVAAGLERLEAARGEREAVEALAEIEQATRRLTGANR